MQIKLRNTLFAFAAAANAINITQSTTDGTNGTTVDDHIEDFAMALARYSLYDVDLAQLDDQIKAQINDYLYIDMKDDVTKGEVMAEFC